MSIDSSKMYQINEKDRYQFEIRIKPEGIHWNNFRNPILFDIIWLSMFLIPTIIAILQGSLDFYFGFILCGVGIVNLLSSLSHFYTKHEIIFDFKSVTFVKRTFFSTTELEMNFLEIDKIHPNHIIKKKKPRWTGRNSKPIDERPKRGLVIYYENTKKYEFGGHLSNSDQKAIAEFVNKRISERQKFIR